MITPEKVRELLKAATPGPWGWRNTRDVYLMSAKSLVVMAFGRMGMQGAQPLFRDEHNLLVDAGRANINDYPDAQLIAAAPEVAQAYIDAQVKLDALREVLETLAPFERADLPYITPIADSIRDALEATP